VGGALFKATSKGSVAASEHRCQKLCGTSEMLAAPVPVPAAVGTDECMYDAPAHHANRAVWLAELWRVGAVPRVRPATVAYAQKP